MTILVSDLELLKYLKRKKLNKIYKKEEKDKGKKPLSLRITSFDQ